MTDLQGLELRASEIRSRLAELGTLEELDTEHRGEMDSLGKEYAANETRQRALKIAGDGPATPVVSQTSEGSEYRGMLDRANLGVIFDDVISHRNTSGVEAELQAHLRIQGNQVPLDMLRKPGGGAGMEYRAVTPAPTNVQGNQQPIIPYIFPQSAAAFLGVDSPTVPTGESVYSVLTSTLDVGTPAENAAQAETTGAYSSVVLLPQRLQSSYIYSIEDRARFAGMDASLRENMSDGLADGLDKEILSGTDGLFTGSNLANNAITVNDTFDTYLNHLVWNQIDGRYAAMTSDLAMVVGAATYKDLGATYRNTSVDRSALDRVMELTSGVRVSAHVPAPASNRQDVVIRRGMSMTVTAPVWEGITIIPDEITKAANGQVVITAFMLYAVKVLRTDAGLVKQGTDHS